MRTKPEIQDVEKVLDVVGRVMLELCLERGHVALEGLRAIKTEEEILEYLGAYADNIILAFTFEGESWKYFSYYSKETPEYVWKLEIALNAAGFYFEYHNNKTLAIFKK